MLCSSQNINNIMKSCKGLTHIHLAIYTTELLDGIDWNQFCELTHVMFTVYAYTDVDTNTVLQSLANHCSMLSYLAVSYETQCDFSAIYDKAALPALSVLNVRRHTVNDDTSMLHLHRPNLQIGRATGYPWHTFEDTVHGKEFAVWK